MGTMETRSREAPGNETTVKFSTSQVTGARVHERAVEGQSANVLVSGGFHFGCIGLYMLFVSGSGLLHGGLVLRGRFLSGKSQVSSGALGSAGDADASSV